MTVGVPSGDIADREDIAGLVTAFYRRAFADDSLGPIFVDIAQLDLAAHLPVMCDFWETVLLRAGLYHRNARPRRRLFHPPPWLGGPPRRNPLHTPRDLIPTRE